MTTGGLSPRILRQIRTFARESGLEQVVLFGSRARGTNRERSDIDLAVKGGDTTRFSDLIRGKLHSLPMVDIVELNGHLSLELQKEIERDGVLIYEKADHYSSFLDVLRSADFSRAGDDEIYRMGVICQFYLTFERAWKVMQDVLRMYGEDAVGLSPGEILKLGYRTGFVEDPEIWQLMLKKRNTSIHVYDDMYDEDEADELVFLIRDSFLPALSSGADPAGADPGSRRNLVITGIQV